MTSTDEHVIDLVGYLKDLWRQKVALIVTFLVVLVAGTAWVLTRPADYVATQTLSIVVPEVLSEAQAVQQSAALPGAAEAMTIVATSPAVLAGVAEANPGAKDLAMALTAKRTSMLTIEVSANASDSSEARKLCLDFGNALVTQNSTLASDSTPALAFQLKPVGEPQAVQLPRGRFVQAAAVGVLAVLASFGVAAVLDAVRRQRAAR